MRLVLWMSCVAILFGSCARMPYLQWNGHLAELENELTRQKETANELSLSEIQLYNGVYDATKKKDAKPYVILSELVAKMTSDHQFVDAKTSDALTMLSAYREKYADKSIRTIGPEWEDYQSLLSQLNKQKEANIMTLTSLEDNSLKFDSVCLANKIRAVAMLDYELQLANHIAELDKRFSDLSSDYSSIKKGITERVDREASLIQINRMKQKIRQVENENLQISNLYARLNSLRSDMILYEGPFIEPLAEIRLINQKASKITSLLNELEGFITDY